MKAHLMAHMGAPDGNPQFVQCDELGRLIAVTDSTSSSSTPNTEDTSDSNTTVVASGSGVLDAVTGVPAASVLIIVVDGVDSVAIGPGEALLNPVSYSTSLAARLIGIAALASHKVTYWLR